jgi:hypothetical protein
MQAPEAQGFSRFGGLLLMVSLFLPFYAFSFGGFSAMSFRLWSLDKGAFVVIAAVALMALMQARISDRSTTALIYLIVGGLFTAALIYRIWISPPGSAPIGDFGGLGGGEVTINGKKSAAGSFSANDILEALGIKLKPTYGAYAAMLGSAFFTVAAFLEWRSAGIAPSTPGHVLQPREVAQPVHGQQQAAAQQAQQQQAWAPPAPAAPAPSVPADPFAPPTPPPAAFPSDPFAPSAEPATAPQPPPAAPQPPPAGTPPQRPPGS